jgi:hypothetical protein
VVVPDRADDLVSIREAEQVRGQVDRLGGVPHEDDLLDPSVDELGMAVRASS